MLSFSLKPCVCVCVCVCLCVCVPIESLVKTITNAEEEELRELVAALHLPESLQRDGSSKEKALANVLQVVNTLHVSRAKQVRFLLPTDHEARIRRRAARNALKKWVRKVRPSDASSSSHSNSNSNRKAAGGGIDADKIPSHTADESKVAQQKRFVCVNCVGVYFFCLFSGQHLHPTSSLAALCVISLLLYVYFVFLSLYFLFFFLKV
jgi:hypothetical protein